MLPADQYWTWFWAHLYYSFLFSIPLILLLIGKVVFDYYQDLYEDDPPKDHFTRLFK